jgi:hypothetical protein
MLEQWRAATPNVRMAAGFFGVGLLGVILLSVLGSLELLSGAWAGLIVLVSAVFQLAGARALHQEGRADPALARSAVIQLLAMARNAEEAESLAQEAFEFGNAGPRRDALGKLSVHLSYLQEQAIQSAETWNSIHSEALDDLFLEDHRGN